MKLLDLTYLVLEEARRAKIVDDERIDLRLIQDWIILKRADLLTQKSSNNFNANRSVNLNNYQKLDLTVTVQDSYTGTFSDFPFDSVEDSGRQSDKIVVSDITVPAILESKQGPMVFSVEFGNDLMKLPFSFVPYDQLRFSGNGKFNSNLIYAAVRDNYLYFKYNSFFDTYSNVTLRAVFENPRQVAGYSIVNDEFPISTDMIEAIKNQIYDKDLRVLLSLNSDEFNDASGMV